MGSSSGKGSPSIFQRISSPLSNFGLGDYDPLGGMIGQGFENTWNLVTGKEGFASHESWFGNTYLGNWGDSVVGAPGYNSQERLQEESNLLWAQSAGITPGITPESIPVRTEMNILNVTPVDEMDMSTTFTETAPANQQLTFMNSQMPNARDERRRSMLTKQSSLLEDDNNG